MAESTSADLKSEFDSLPIPSLDPDFFSDDFNFTDNFLSFDDQDFDITFDDDVIDFPNSVQFLADPDPDPDLDPSSAVVNSDPESGSRVLSCESGSDVACFLNSPSPESSDRSALGCHSPESGGRSCSGNQNPASSQGSGNCGSEALNCASPDSAHNSVNEVVEQKVNPQDLEFEGKSLLKRKKDKNADASFSGSRSSKIRRCNTGGSESANQTICEEDEKKKARLIRNRESAQLSRQRKKHYVEELEDKVRAMHSTIQDLNAKISYIVAENASLRQQMAAGGPVCPPPPHLMYPHPYPWMHMPCPPYVVKPQGSQVPLVPIPRLKPQTASTSKPKKVEPKKTKKVAGVSFLGLLLFIMLFGGLVPLVNVKFGANSAGGSNYTNNRFYDQHRGRVLTVNHHVNGTNHDTGIGYSNEKLGATNGRGHGGGGETEFGGPGNSSESLVASLYVPRNDKLVKIDGNLIIHSILASEKAMASKRGVMTKKESGSLATALDLAPAISVPLAGKNSGRHPHIYRTSTEGQRALKSDSENLKSKADGKLQQWFREGLAGPMLSSGMCTEVFQFDVSGAAASGAIVPATAVRNFTASENRESSAYINKGRNRRILHGLPIPLPESSNNITKEQATSNNSTGKENSHKQNTSLSSSMVVSVLVDPREAGDGDGDGDGVMGAKKSFSRIFVVVLLDSVKYVTYSCMLPLIGSSHLVTT